MATTTTACVQFNTRFGLYVSTSWARPDVARPAWRLAVDGCLFARGSSDTSQALSTLLVDASAPGLSARRITMKRDGSELLSHSKPPRAVHGRMLEFDTKPDPPALEPSLSRPLLPRRPMNRNPPGPWDQLQESSLSNQLPHRSASS